MEEKIVTSQGNMDPNEALDYSSDTSISYEDLRMGLILTGKWMEYPDMAKMRNTILKKLKNDQKFSITELNNRVIITNNNLSEKIVYLDPRLYDTDNIDANADEIERIGVINDLLGNGSIGGEITFAQPISTNQKHWTLVCFKVDMNEARKIIESKKEDIKTDDLNKLIKNDKYIVDSLEDGMQKDEHSCGVCAMDAFLELCYWGFDKYKKIYEYRCQEKSKRISESINNKNAKQTDELVKKKEEIADLLGLDEKTKKFFINYTFYDEDIAENILGVIKGIKDPTEKMNLIKDIKGNIVIALKEANRQFDKKISQKKRIKKN